MLRKRGGHFPAGADGWPGWPGSAQLMAVLAVSTAMTDSFPRQQARTQRFTLGAPRSFQIAPDGDLVVFLRSRGGTDLVTCLWALDVPSGTERLVADPHQ